jgi:2,5-furandicarboxylate decarboxylase 1
MVYKDLREFLEHLEQEGELIRIGEELNPEYEIAAVLKELDSIQGEAVLVERVKGYPGPVVGNLLGTERRLDMALGVVAGEFKSEYKKRRGNPLPPRVIEGKREVVLTEDIDIGRIVPALTHSEGDIAPYITAGLVFAKDLQSGILSMAIHEIQLRGGNKLGIMLGTPPISNFYAAAEAEGKPLEVAVVIGVEPATLLASCVLALAGESKLDIAGGLRMEAVDLVKAETVALEVPATAELVLEGRVLPSVRVPIGPFGDMTGYYLEYEAQLLEIRAITHRRDFIYQALLPQGRDAFHLIAPTWEIEVEGFIQGMLPAVQAVHLTPGSICDLAVVSLRKGNEAQARQVLYTLLSQFPTIKQAIVVDEDVDIYSLDDVLWACGTRFQGDEDLLVLPRILGSDLDPSAKPGYITAKVGLDATKPLDKLPKFQRARMPEEAKAKAKRLLTPRTS